MFIIKQHNVYLSFFSAFSLSFQVLSNGRLLSWQLQSSALQTWSMCLSAVICFIFTLTFIRECGRQKSFCFRTYTFYWHSRTSQKKWCSLRNKVFSPLSHLSNYHSVLSIFSIGMKSWPRSLRSGQSRQHVMGSFLIPMARLCLTPVHVSI